MSLNKSLAFTLLSSALLLFSACSKQEPVAESIGTKIEVKKDESQSVVEESKRSGIVAITSEVSIEGVYASAEEVQPLKVGSLVPSFTVRSVDNSIVEVNPAELEKPVLLTFFRGGWCPYCNRHLAELRMVEKELQENGFAVWFMSIDKPEFLYDSLKEPEIGYTLYSDAELNATKTFGIGFVVDAVTIKKYIGYGIDLEKSSGQSHHVLPAPSTFIIGTDGKIHFQYTNADYTVRMSPEEIMLAADKYLESLN